MSHKEKPSFVFKIMYPLGVLLSKLPTLAYGLHELNPKKQVWTVKYHQVPPNVVWFCRYPNHLVVEHIGAGSYSANAIEVNNFTLKISIGDHCRISSNLKIIYKSFYPSYKEPPSVKLGNDVWIGKDVKLLVPDEGLTICDKVIIGAGGIVTKSIGMSGTYAGNPARLVSKTVAEI